VNYDLSQEATFINKKEISNMVLFLTGKLVSLLGTSIYGFAIGLYVLKLTGSGMSFALTIVISMIPRIILSPFAGSIADRINRKTLVVSMDLACGALLMIVYLISLSQGLTLGLIYISAFLLTVFNTFFSVSFDAAVPNLVNDDKLMKINSMNQSIVSLSNILGPALGGLVYGIFDIKYFVLFNAVSFILSGISESFINFDFNSTKTEEKDVDEENKEKSRIFKNVLNDTVEGFKYLKNQKLLYSLMKYILFINLFFGGFFVSLPYITVTELKLSDAQYGTIYSLFALGSLVFSIVISMLPEIKKKYRIISIGLLVEGILIIAGSLAPVSAKAGIAENVVMHKPKTNPFTNFDFIIIYCLLSYIFLLLH